MTRFVFLIAVLLVVSAPAFAGTGNWVTNGDFEQGLTGWTWGQTPLFGAGTIAPTAFNAAGQVPLTAYDGTKSGAKAVPLAPKSGGSIGWAREGAFPGAAWSYVYQTVHVNPGTYNLDQSVSKWDACAGTTNMTTRFTAMFLVRVDSQIGTAYSGASGTYALRASRWDDAAPANGWLTKQFNGGGAASFATTTGNVQLILAFEDHAGETLGAGTGQYYGYAAFDNVRFETVEAIPEPSALLALFSGVAGLAGLALRRRK